MLTPARTKNIDSGSCSSLKYKLRLRDHLCCTDLNVDSGSARTLYIDSGSCLKCKLRPESTPELSDHFWSAAVLNMIRFPDRDPTGFCNSEQDPDRTGF